MAVQFCINQVGSLAMNVCYFGQYNSNAFELFYRAWKRDIDQVWLSEARYHFLR